MRYGEIKKCDIANGEGVRVFSFLFQAVRIIVKAASMRQRGILIMGKKFTQETEEEILKALEPEYVNGLSVLGGEPFEPQNQRVLVPFLKKVKERYPGRQSGAIQGYLLTGNSAKKAGQGAK